MYEVLAREYIMQNGNAPVGELHRRAVCIVSAKSQSKAFDALSEALTEEEMSILKRGRNAKISSAPHGTQVVDYKRATAIEALFGYLYLKGEVERMNRLFSLIIDVILQEQPVA